jgi:Caspase domain
MRTTWMTWPALLIICALPVPVSAQAEVRRFVLAAGANFGGADRPPLRYAVSDAERFAAVLTDLGGVDRSNAMLLKEPRVRDLVQALDQLSRRVSEARRPSGGGRTEVLVYYSGHADEKGLLLGEDRYSYQSLRDRLDEMPADVRIAVLDACASGAFTRLKGGKARKPFLVDESLSMRGHAFLTSSAETEAAQESDHIGASYFTYYLVSGLRGAADVSGEGRVTLNEAYQFAFNETLGKTAGSGAGAQHPSYDINLSGTGDVVITDVRQTTASIVLGEFLDGRVFIRNAKQELVVELYKPLGRRVEIGLGAGEYEVRIQRPATAMLTRSTIRDGQRVELTLEQFTPTKPEPTRRRGGPPSFAVAGRNRIELRLGMWRGSGAPEALPKFALGAQAVDFRGGLRYTRFLREDLAATLSFDVLPAEADLVTFDGFSSSGTSQQRSLVISVPLGLRWDPQPGDLRTKPVKLYLAAGLGPVIGLHTGGSVDEATAFAGTRAAMTVGGFLGGGADVLLGRRWSIGVSAGYTWMTDFPQTIGTRKNYSGVDVGIGIGWMWGKGYGQ